MQHPFLAVVTAVGLAAAVGTTSQASTRDDQIMCEQKSGDASIAACTRLIQSGQLNNIGTAQAFMLRGGTYFIQQLYDKAIADFSNAMRLAPNTGSLFLMRGSAYLSKGDYVSALADCQRAQALDPNVPGVAGCINDASRMQARSSPTDREKCGAMQGDQSIAACTRLIESEKMSVNDLMLTYTFRGYTFRNLHQYEETISDFNRVINFAPNKSGNYVVRGDIYMLKGDLQTALSDYQTALKLDPNNREAAQGSDRVKKAIAAVTPQTETPPPPTGKSNPLESFWQSIAPANTHDVTNLIAGYICLILLYIVSSRIERKVLGDLNFWRRVWALALSNVFYGLGLYALGLGDEVKLFALPMGATGLSVALMFSVGSALEKVGAR